MAALDVQTEIGELVAARRERRGRAPARAELRTFALAGLVFAVLATALALTGWSDRPWDAGRALVLVLAYAAATRIVFEAGLGSTDGTLLVLVPMLLTLPAEIVPLLCAGGLALGRVPDYAQRRIHPARALYSLGNSIHALAPAAVIALGVSGAAGWEDWPWYVLALLAYLATDLLFGLLVELGANGVRPRLQLAVLAEVSTLDLLLAPVGLMAAFATEHAPAAFLLAAPIGIVLTRDARSRSERLDAEREVVRTRERVLATTSHELQLPVATLVGMTSLLTERGAAMDERRRAEAERALRVEALGLRQLVRQRLDFLALQAGQELRPDPTRARQIADALRAVAGRTGAPEPVEVPGGWRLTVPGTMPASPAVLTSQPTDAGGIDLVVAAALCAVMGGRFSVEPGDGEWSLLALLASD